MVDLAALVCWILLLLFQQWFKYAEYIVFIQVIHTLQKEQLQEIINNLDEMKATEEDRTNLTEAVTILVSAIVEIE